MSTSQWLTSAVFGLLLTAVPSWASEPLDADTIEALVYGNTTACRKEKDQSLCTNFFSTEGEFKRRMHEDDARKDGRWFLDDSDRLCILWDGRIKPMCFVVTENPDGTFALTKHGKHISTILGISEGNTEGL